MRATHEPDHRRPIAHRVGDLVLWSSADGTPLGVSSAVPEGDTRLWAALVGATVPAGPCEATARAEAFAASLGTAAFAPGEADEPVLDLDEEAATLAFLARLSA